MIAEGSKCKKNYKKYIFLNSTKIIIKDIIKEKKNWCQNCKIPYDFNPYSWNYTDLSLTDPKNTVTVRSDKVIIKQVSQ